MDYKTLFLVLVSVFLIQAGALLQTWRQNREEIGIRDWAVAAILMSFGSLFSVVGLDILPPVDSHATTTASIILRGLGGAMAASGWLLVWMGARHFFRKTTIAYIHVSVLAVALLAIASLPLIFALPMGWRLFWVSSTISLLAAMTLYEFVNEQTRRNPTILLIAGMLLFTSTIWLLRALVNIGFIQLNVSTQLIDALALYDGIVASVSLTVSMILLTNERINRRLREQALRDPLTGALNRRAFFEYSRPLLADLHRGNGGMAICIIDLEHFKAINDTHGHSMGDRVLKRFTSMAHAILREGDIFARYGGEEFVLLLRNSSHEQALQIIERLREACANLAHRAEEEIPAITCSAGISHVSGPVSVELEAMLEAADDALYQAKNAGRDRVMLTLQKFAYTPA